MQDEAPTVWFHEVQRPRWTLWMRLAVVLWCVVLLGPLVRSPARISPPLVLNLLVLTGAVLSLTSRFRTMGIGSRLELERHWGTRREIDLRHVRSVRTSSYYRRMDGPWGVRDGEGVILGLDDGDVLYVGSARAHGLCEAIRARLSAPTATRRSDLPVRIPAAVEPGSARTKRAEPGSQAR